MSRYEAKVMLRREPGRLLKASHVLGDANEAESLKGRMSQSKENSVLVVLTSKNMLPTPPLVCVSLLQFSIRSKADP